MRKKREAEGGQEKPSLKRVPIALSEINSDYQTTDQCFHTHTLYVVLTFPVCCLFTCAGPSVALDFEILIDRHLT